MQQPTQVTTEFVRRHYSRGPTAYREDGSIARMPSADDIAYCELQFDQWLAAHDAEVLTRAGSPGSTGTGNQREPYPGGEAMSTDMEAIRDRYLEEHGHHADAKHGFESGWRELAFACRVVYDGPGSFEERVARILRLTAFSSEGQGA